jgi:hypothetical protein
LTPAPDGIGRSLQAAFREEFEDTVIQREIIHEVLRFARVPGETMDGFIRRAETPVGYH